MSALPLNWTIAPLASVAGIQLGKMLDAKRTRGKPFPYLRNINIRWGEVDTSDLLTMPFTEEELERFSVLEGDVLVCEGGEPGRAAVWLNSATSIKYQKALHRVRLKGRINPKWLVYHLYFDAQRGALAERFTGTTIKHFTGIAIRSYPLTLAPLAEQRRVIEGLDSYLTRLAAAEANLARVQANLKRYRASVLKAAVEGRLVPTEAELARREGRDYEPATELLQRILVERRRRWEEAELAKMTASGRGPKDDRWKEKYQEPAAPDTTRLPQLPEGWCWARLEQLATLIRNGYPGAPDADSGSRILRISAVRPLSVDLRDVRFLSENHPEATGFLLENGDLLFTRYNGNPGLVGVCGEIRGLIEPTAHPDKLIRVALVRELTEAGYIEIVAATGQSRRHLESRTRTTAGQAGISGSDLRQMPLPLAPLAEQRRITSEVAGLFSIAAETDSVAAESGQRTTRLRQSILKWAFEGKLVDQDPNDEPAEALLARIRAEREATAQGTLPGVERPTRTGSRRRTSQEAK